MRACWTFTIGVTLLAALVFGLAPLSRRSCPRRRPALRQGGGALTTSRRVFGNGLVVAQVAISLPLLSVSQLYIGTCVICATEVSGSIRDACC
jgi:hypothetical protein